MLKIWGAWFPGPFLVTPMYRKKVGFGFGQIPLPLPVLTLYICHCFSNIRAGTELTWDYNYEIGSVPGRTINCYCGSTKCRKRLLWFTFSDVFKSTFSVTATPVRCDVMLLCCCFITKVKSINVLWDWFNCHTFPLEIRQFSDCNRGHEDFREICNCNK